MSQEIVFCSHEESHIVMSEKVQSLAGSIYQEFERMISKYDEEVVKNLMPLVVNVLECLDLAYMENQEHEVELELLREDNEQLITQYEREKQLRKSTEQKLLEMEDNVEDEQKMLCSKIESLESIVRMFELKFKNSSDHVNRLEEKEQDMKKEYSKLHERYTELFKTHMEHIERTKNLLSTADKAENTARSRNSSNFVQFNRSSGPVSFGFSSLEPASTIKLSSSPVEFSALSTSPLDSCQLTIDVDQRAQSPQEISEATGNDKMGWSETISVTSKDASPDEISEDSPPPTKAPSTPAGRSTTQSERRSANTLYQELSFQDSEVLKEVDDGADIAEEIESESETQPSSVNDAFFGMGKEIENLILENNELLATKNALNIVKDDLIAKVDELTSEQEILREEVRVLTTVKTKLKRKIVDLEDELRKVKEEAEKFKKSNVANEDEDVPMAQRKRFTRMEMARVLTERNQYKEKFMELQEAIKWTELVRANKSSPSNGPVDKKNKQTFWKFFSGLFSGSSEENPGAGASFYPSGTHLSNPVYNMNPSMESFRKKQIQDQKRSGDFVDLGSLYSEKVAARRANERKEQFRQVRAHVSKEDGRVQVYGWSLPAKQSSLSQVSSSQSLLSSPPQVPVPVPVYCRPLEENEPGVKIWCATGVVLNNDLNFPNSQNLCDSNVNLRNLKSVDHFSSLDSAISDNSKDLKISESKLDGSKINDEIPPSLVWICTSTHSISKVTILNANNPADILASFSVCSSILLCIASVTGDPGIDPGIDPENERIPKVETEELNLSENSEETLLGKILYITDAENSKIKNEISSNASSNQTISDNQNAEKKVNAQHTIWLGSKDGSIFVHSAVSQWKQCLYSTRLKDSVLNILPISGRVFCALADGTIAVFKKGEDHQWDLSKYYLLVLGPSQHSVKCLLRVYENIWASSKNNIHIIDPVSLVIKNSFVAHPRKDSQVRQMVWTGDGVWVSIRLDSTLRLYHAQTLDHLQDVDVEPYVSKMLGTGKLGFSLIKITALLISCQRLWIGTGNGVIISVPLSQRNVTTDGSAVNQDESTKTDVTEHPSVTNSKFIPYCNMAQAQLSFHGYRDAVKFFVAVPGLGSVLSKTSSKEETPVDHITSSRNSSSVLILSGGEGYIDFRIGESSDCSDEKFSEEKETSSLSLREKNHLIVWQVIEGDQIRN